MITDNRIFSRNFAVYGRIHAVFSLKTVVKHRPRLRSNTGRLRTVFDRNPGRVRAVFFDQGGNQINDLFLLICLMKNTSINN
jgi:hypothetical protein